MCLCDQLRKLVAKERPVGRMSLQPWGDVGIVQASVRTKFCLQQRKTSLLLAYIEITQHFSLQILVLYF